MPEGDDVRFHQYFLHAHHPERIIVGIHGEVAAGLLGDEEAQLGAVGGEVVNSGPGEEGPQGAVIRIHGKLRGGCAAGRRSVLQHDLLLRTVAGDVEEGVGIDVQGAIGGVHRGDTRPGDHGHANQLISVHVQAHQIAWFCILRVDRIVRDTPGPQRLSGLVPSNTQQKGISSGPPQLATVGGVVEEPGILRQTEASVPVGPGGEVRKTGGEGGVAEEGPSAAT